MTNTSWAPAFDNLPPEELVFGRSASMHAVRVNMAKVAMTNVPVLIRGESGTGKETIAKLIHRWSTDGGTLLLDEVAELTMPMQAKLLEVLQNGQFSRLGGSGSTTIDARIQCTTNHSLERDICAGSFRNDLFYRINVVAVDVPPLRERREDIPILAEYFRQRYNGEYGCQTGPISDRTLRLFTEHRWPGNIRELENLVKRYVILQSEDAIAQELLAGGWSDPVDKLNGNDQSVSLKTLTREAVRALERKIILQTLHANNWNRKEAARILKVSYRGLFYKIKNSGVPAKKTKPGAAQSSEVAKTP